MDSWREALVQNLENVVGSQKRHTVVMDIDQDL